MAAPSEASSWRLESRLRARLLGWLAVLWLAGVAAAMLALRDETGEVLDSALTETAQRLLLLPESALAQAAEEAEQDFGPHEEYLVYQVYGEGGTMRLRSHAAPTEPLLPTAARGFAQAGGWRVLALERGDGRRRVQVAESLEHRAEVLWESSLWLALPLLAVLPIAAWVLHRVLRSGFRSLEPARSMLEREAVQGLQPLPLAGLPGELLPLATALNALIDRVRMLLEAERSFAARTAHELRTPLAAARAQAQRLLPLSAGEAREHAQALVRQLDRIGALAGRLLQIARVESGVAWRRERVDLGLLARVVADEFPESRGGRLQLVVDDDAGAVSGDADALGIALRNLLDNALRHGGPQARVRLHAARGRLVVHDDGPGVAAAELPRLVRPFERGSEAGEGSGLGLAMADTVARQSGGRLGLRSPVQAGRGFEAVLELPAAEPR